MAKMLSILGDKLLAVKPL